MVASAEQIAADALALPFEKRVQLLSLLLESVDRDDNALFDEAWAAELERRQKAVSEGAETFAAEEVFAELRREDV